MHPSYLGRDKEFVSAASEGCLQRRRKRGKMLFSTQGRRVHFPVSGARERRGKQNNSLMMHLSHPFSLCVWINPCQTRDTTYGKNGRVFRQAGGWNKKAAAALLLLSLPTPPTYGTRSPRFLPPSSRHLSDDVVVWMGSVGRRRKEKEEEASSSRREKEQEDKGREGKSERG